MGKKNVKALNTWRPPLNFFFVFWSHSITFRPLESSSWVPRDNIQSLHWCQGPKQPRIHAVVEMLLSFPLSKRMYLYRRISQITCKGRAEHHTSWNTLRISRDSARITVQLEDERKIILCSTSSCSQKRSLWPRYDLTINFCLINS